MQDGTAAPPITIAQPEREEDRPASRHLIIGRCGIGASIVSAVVYLLALGSVLDGDAQTGHDAWNWGRGSLITFIVAGLVLAGYGYGVEAANRREQRSLQAVENARTAAAAKVAAVAAEVIAAVTAARVHMHDDHAVLHRENCELREEVTALRADVKAVYELLAVMRQESPPAQIITRRVGELHQRQDEAEKVLAEVAAKVDVAYTVGFTDGVGQATE